MRIFMCELKKIWRPWIIIALVLINYQFYTDQMKYAANWSERVGFGVAEIAVLTDLTAEYGEQLSYDEWLDAHKYLAEGEQSEYDSIAEFNPGERAVVSAETKQRALGNLLTSLEPFYENEDYLFGEFIAINGELLSENSYEKGLAYLQKNIPADSYMNIFPRLTINAFGGTYFPKMIMIVAISLTTLLIPLLTYDRFSRMTPLQYSSKNGRKLIKTQFAAVMASGLLVGITLAVIYIALFLNGNKDFAPFINQKIFTVMFAPRLFPAMVDITYMQYIIIHAIFIMIFSVLTTAVVFFLSMKSKDYITLLLKAIPVIIVISGISYAVGSDIFGMCSIVFNIFPIIGIEFYISVILAVIGVWICLVACKKIRGKDIF